MSTSRLEAFSDGVIAIIITIMVLELRPPHGADIAALHPLVPEFLTYILSFVFLGIYWNNHHHMLHATDKVKGGVLWANLHLLFWLSLIPFTTGWLGENGFAVIPTAVYGFVMLMCGLAYSILTMTVVASSEPDSLLRRAVGSDAKGKISVASYAAAIPLAFVSPFVSIAIYVLIAFIWLVPDRRIEGQVG